jgi:hypothetical protein
MIDSINAMESRFGPEGLKILAAVQIDAGELAKCCTYFRPVGKQDFGV